MFPNFLEEMKLTMFAKSCLCPGLIAMCSNLVCSSDVSENSKKEKKWIQEYRNGQKYEIYMVKIIRPISQSIY
jgi:potassium large conductance calcium-activated channel subfamily M alpha protein 1